MNMLKIKKHLVLFLVALSALFVLSACGGSTTNTTGGSEKYKIRVALSLDETNPLMLSFPVFKEIVEERSNGRIEVEYVGGPEAIPPFNQAEAVQNGTIDMGWVAGSYYPDIVPEVLGISFSELTYEQELEKGSIEYLSKIHEEKMNVKLIGRAGHGDLTLHVSNEHEIKSSKDLAGLNFRGTSVYVPAIEAAGGSAIALEAGEIYSSLEKGLIDGYGWMNFSLPELGAQELTGYQIEPYIGKADQLILANLNFYNSLPEDLQQLINDAAKEAYFDARDQLDKILEEERKVLTEAGVQFIKLEDAEEYEKLVREKKWEWAATRVNDVEELKSYFLE